MLVIGSTALRLAGIPGGTPRDLDLMGTINDVNHYSLLRRESMISCVYIQDGKKSVLKFKDKPFIVEIELAFDGTTAKELLDKVNQLGENIILSKSTPEGFDIANPNVCLTLKLSHRYLKTSSLFPGTSPLFLKTRTDIIELRELGYKVPECLSDWLKEREKETYNYSHPSLVRSKDDFFDANEGVNYVYEHDDIHQAVAHLQKPAYMYFKGDEKDVMVDKGKWDNLNISIKRLSVVEESYVLALERCLIPFGFKHPPRRAFLKALEKCCTSIASGWWREFAWENYDRIAGLYNVNFVGKFQKALSDGLIRPYQNPTLFQERN